MIDSQTGVDDEYDEAIKFCINEIIDEIHRLKELDSLAVESVYYTIFKQDVEERYREYLKELQQ
jgi:rhamnogalacturonyl hydrolase YesR